jgi:hypothetical protein
MDVLVPERLLQQIRGRAISLGLAVLEAGWPAPLVSVCEPQFSTFCVDSPTKSAQETGLSRPAVEHHAIRSVASFGLAGYSQIGPAGLVVLWARAPPGPNGGLDERRC